MGIGSKYGIIAETGNNIQTLGLVAYWDAAYKKSYISSSLDTYNLASGSLTPTGSLKNDTGFVGLPTASWVFDGTDDYIDIGSPSTGTGTHTISMWINPTTITNDDRIISNLDTDNFSLRFWSGNIQVWGKTNGSAAWTTFLTSFSIDTWYHIVIVHDGAGTVTGYKNNVADTPITSEPDISNLGIGARFNNAFGDEFHGNIANTQIYNRALSSADILQNFNAQKDRFGL